MQEHTSRREGTGRWSGTLRTSGRLTAVAVAGWLAAATLPVASGATTSRAPFADHSAVGSLGLCNRAGRQVTSGSVDATPFAWRVVSSSPAPAGYRGAGRTATLYAYQPRPGLTPGQWSGAQLTASSRYSNPAHPMAAATSADDSLRDFIEEYPPKWDGFVELRLYLSAPAQQAETSRYSALDIKITGRAWRAVGGSPAACNSGTAESLETLVLPTTTTTLPTTSSSTNRVGTDSHITRKGHR